MQETNFEGLIESLITTFSNLIDTDLTDDPLLKENIRNHFEPMVNRLRNNISHPNPFLGQLKRDYFLVFNILWFSVPEIEEELEVSFNSDEIGFPMIYFQLALERERHEKIF
ncbi:PRD domain-containing protein [Erysipelothrix sp. D19-032]